MLQLRISNNPGDASTVSMKKIDGVVNDLWPGFIAVFFNIVDVNLKLIGFPFEWMRISLL